MAVYAASSSAATLYEESAPRRTVFLDLMPRARRQQPRQGSIVAEIAFVLHAGSAIRQQDAAVLHVSVQLAGGLIGHDRQVRRENQPVFRQIRTAVHDVHIDAGPHEGVVVAFDGALQAVARESGLETQGPEVVVVVDDGDIRDHGRAAQMALQLAELRGRLSGLAVTSERLAVVSEQPVPVLLPADGAGAPAEPDLAVGAVGELLIGDLADLARPGIAAEALPAAGPRRLLHDHEVPLLEAPHDVGGQGAS